MAVLGNRGNGILEALVEGFRRSGQDMQQPNMSPVGRTPLEQTLNRPQVQAGAYGGMVTTMPDGTIAEANQVPLMRDLTRGRILDPMDPSRQMPEPMPVQQAVSNEESRREALKKAQEAATLVEQGAADSQDPSIMQGIKNYFGSRENMVKLALAFNSMRLNPDTALATTLGQELKDIRATSTDEALRNKTAAYFDNVDPKIAAAIRGGLDAKDAIALYRDKEKGVVVGKMVINPTTGDVIYDGSSEGSDLPDSVQKIIWGAKQLNLQPGTQAYQDYITSQLSKSKGMSFRMRPDGTVEFSEGGDLGSMTEGQGKGLMFSQRMKASQNILNQVEAEGTSLFNSLVNQIPLASNYLTSPEYKLYDQAKRDFINAVLRYESGAAIGAAEFDNAEQQYFPQPGDTPAVIAQKRANRDLAIQTMSAVAGPDAAKYEEIIRTQLIGPQAANWPAVGTEENGYRYIGGDPSIQSNWVKK